jgi:hypothetical protein
MALTQFEKVRNVDSFFSEIWSLSDISGWCETSECAQIICSNFAVEICSKTRGERWKIRKLGLPKLFLRLKINLLTHGK